MRNFDTNTSNFNKNNIFLLYRYILRPSQMKVARKPMKFQI